MPTSTTDLETNNGNPGKDQDIASRYIIMLLVITEDWIIFDGILCIQMKWFNEMSLTQFF